VEHGLPLLSPAFEVAGSAVVPNGGHVPHDRAPASNLPGVVGASPADVVAAISLKPPARILPVNPAVATPDGERLRRIYAKTVQARIVPLAAQPRASEPALRKLGAAVGQVFPAETPSCSIAFGVSCGVKAGAKFRPTGSVRQ